ncbi:MAG: hypothetical protein ACKOVA_01800 [Novosphingobium sp.]
MEEDTLLRRLYPSYRQLVVALPHRSLAALKHRVRRIGIVNTRHVWTNLEVRRLREAYQIRVPDKELEPLFPGLALSQIKAKAQHIGAPHRRGARVLLGVKALDAIRQRATARGISLVELDRQARTGKFFQKSRRQPMLRQISRAAEVLGGEVHIEWSVLD